MKKNSISILFFLILSFVLVACNNSSKSEEALKIGMLIDSGSIDDKSFNQGTWEGIQRYVEDHEGVKAQFVQPSGETTEDYVTSGDNLIMAGSNIVIAPGFKFEEAITKLQQENPEVKFILLDGQPSVESPNTMSIYFAENEAGFLVGMAAALQSKTEKVAFIGGMKIPAVEKFGRGYVAGVAYANQLYGTKTIVTDYQFQGTFYDVQGGQMMAGGMYDKGVDIIFSAAAAVGNGVINEAKARTENQEEVYVIGVDIDQYEEGKLGDDQSVILTSAIKRIDNAAYDALDDIAQSEFRGGEVIIMDAKANGVGIPLENPNLTTETLEKIEAALNLMKNDQLSVPKTAEELTAFLAEYQYDASLINYN
ncbi:BMP family lipoprotein [Turicibacter sanguinis]|uniref:BMP family lipoprotein n=1 Tax=Turicibacter sanguinis TaxID=154288 RepID=UPI0018AA503E|nr:BMP family ABC transporter substrate-binding protein [Turicibacter sanguinis]MDB8553471.1 BMP family ABC transporter substrate-binding protein [Turicibacter sanguinis]